MDWPDDVAAVADALELGPLLLLSFSAGTPFLLACCVHLRGRVLAAASVAGLAPLDRPGPLDAASVARRTWWAIARHRRAIRALDGVMAHAVRVRPHDVVDRHAQKAPPPESRRLREPDVLADMVQAYRQALAQGAGAVAHEHHLLASSWGFSLDDVECPVRLWHGEDDRLLRAENSRWLASQLPHADARIVPGAGHFMVLTHGEEIARDLVLASNQP